MSALPLIDLTREDIAGFDQAVAREWLLTNGLGGYAAGTVGGACTRRYHGLLVAALRPPVQRTVLVAKCDVVVRYRGRDYALDTNEYADGTIDPHGYRLLQRFRLQGLLPEWDYLVGDLRLRRRIWMAHGQNTTFVSFEVLAASEPVRLSLHPLCTYRDYHALARGTHDYRVEAVSGGCAIEAGPGATPYRLCADVAVFDAAPAWHWNVLHRVERERGLDDVAELFRPGVFTGELAPGESMTLTLTTQTAPPAALALRRERQRQETLLATLPAAIPDWIRRLVLAADQFIVSRAAGASVIAGYPWFTDWGRDTMIALPGLTLATGRAALARSILETFATHVSEGMLPNRFPDGGEAPEYNTVDATLWFVLAVEACLAQQDDTAFAQALYPVLADIVDWHLRGTRFGIKVDAADELLAAGVPGAQLTWMDARIGAHVVTPRHGKAVEINALWQQVLLIVAALAERSGEQPRARELRERARRHAEHFRRRFWHAASGHLFDVVDTPDGTDDVSLRPNQLFAVALSETLLETSHQRAVVEVCQRELWTPFGLRSLARTHPEYRGGYRGGPAERDAAYHQGTVWSWLLGPFARAHYRVHRDAAAAHALLEPISGHLAHAALGTVNEIFDGEPPHAARGCFAQAWSVAEVLSAWFAIDGAARGNLQQEVQP